MTTHGASRYLIAVVFLAAIFGLAAQILWQPSAGASATERQLHSTAINSTGDTALLLMKPGGAVYTRILNEGERWGPLVKHGSTWASADIAINEEGEAWLALMKPEGSLYTRKLGSNGWSKLTRHGAAGAWNPDTGVSITTNNDQAAYVALLADNQIRTRTLTEGSPWGPLVKHGSTWASADIAINEEGEAWLALMKPEGSLYTRKLGSNGWSKLTRHGAAGAWNPDTGVSITTNNDQAAYVALLADNQIRTRTLTEGSPWGPLVKHGSTWASADIAINEEGEAWLALMKPEGSLYTRKLGSNGWSKLTRHGAAGAWNPDTGVSITTNNDQAAYVALLADNQIRTRTLTEGSPWGPLVKHGSTWASADPSGSITLSQGAGTRTQTCPNGCGYAIVSIEGFEPNTQYRLVVDARGGPNNYASDWCSRALITTDNSGAGTSAECVYGLWGNSIRASVDGVQTEWIEWNAAASPLPALPSPITHAAAHQAPTTQPNNPGNPSLTTGSDTHSPNSAQTAAGIACILEGGVSVFVQAENLLADNAGRVCAALDAIDAAQLLSSSGSADRTKGAIKATCAASGAQELSLLDAAGRFIDAFCLGVDIADAYSLWRPSTIDQCFPNCSNWQFAKSLFGFSVN